MWANGAQIALALGRAMIPRTQAAFNLEWPADRATRRPQIWKKSAN
jgi:hypothetical protein